MLNTDLGTLNLLTGLVIAVAGFIVQWQFLKEDWPAPNRLERFPRDYPRLQ